ncbi:hypothetical protein [Novilysobacter erysipheiresistens]|uniref:Uncharacterized protein n=1 Tax=Novilysobacter erysipheiresistens TaxID=1749332 RepID=A0ABU7YUD3_9GAMM
MTDRMADSLQWLSAQFSADDDEFRKAQHPGGEMLLMGAVSKGYAIRQGDRVAVSDAGRRRMGAE